MSTKRFAALAGVLLVAAQLAAAQPAVTSFHVDEKGFIHTWLLRGPFACEQGKTRTVDFLKDLGGESRVFSPEDFRRVPFLSPPVSGGTGFLASLSPGLRIPLVDFFRPNEWVLAYAACWVVSPEERHAFMKVGSDDGVQVWLNGSQVLRRLVYRSWRRDDDAVPVVLHKGRNFLLLKVDQGVGGWEFSVRFTDRGDRPMTDLRIELPVKVDSAWFAAHLPSFVRVSATQLRRAGERSLQFRLAYRPLVDFSAGAVSVRSDAYLGDRLVLSGLFDVRFPADKAFQKKRTLQPAGWRPGIYTLVNRIFFDGKRVSEQRNIFFW